jgi:hypothetical protein
MKTILVLVVLFTTPLLIAQDIRFSEYQDVNFKNCKDLYQSDSYKKVDFKSVNSDSLIIYFYPNPAQKYIVIKSTEVIDEVSLYNASGKEVLRTKPINDKISIESLKNGFYLIAVESKGRIIKKKIIKKML